MKRIILLLLAVLLLFAGCGTAEQKYDLVLDAEEITTIRIQDKLSTGDYSTIDLEEDIKHFCDEFNDISFHFVRSYSDKDDRPAGSICGISFYYKDRSSVHLSVTNEKAIQIGDNVYHTASNKLMDLLDYPFRYAEQRAIYEFAESINKKLAEYEHFKGTEVDAEENIIIVYSSSMNREVLDSFRSIIGSSEYSIVCLSAE